MKNKKGFTLVEIIVAIAVGSVVLMVAGSMMVSSFKFMFSTTETDSYKLKTDKIIDLVRSDIQYAYDVRLVKSEDAPTGEGWHSYYVDKGMLYRDGEIVLNSGFYEGKKLEILAKGNFENGVRVDFAYHLNDSEDYVYELKEKLYGARDTIMFLNVRTAKEILEKGLYNGEAKVPLTKEGYVLYFNNILSSSDPDGPKIIVDGNEFSQSTVPETLPYGTHEIYFDGTLVATYWGNDLAGIAQGGNSLKNALNQLFEKHWIPNEVKIITK